MDASTFLQQFQNNKKTETVFNDLLKWCIENLNAIDFLNKDCICLYENAMLYLFNVRIGRWNELDAQLVIYYLSKKFAHRFFIVENIKIAILDNDIYEEKYGKFIAECTDNGNCDFTVTYSSKVVAKLMSNEYISFRRGLQIIYHEIIHVLQNCTLQQKSLGSCPIPYTRTMYIMALETITRKVDPKFYYENYDYLLKENHAEKIGLQESMKTIQQYNLKLFKQYDQEEISSLLETYDNRFYENDILLFQKYGKSIEQMDIACCLFLEKQPKYIEKFPILKLAFHLDGTKKDIIELLNDRKIMLENGEDKNRVNQLYATIANCKNYVAGGLLGTKAELYQLDEYIKTTGTDDVFVYDLIYYRLKNKTNMTPEQIQNYMQIEKK